MMNLKALCKRHLRMEFVGIGTYGAAVLKAILEGGHNDPETIFYEGLDNTRCSQEAFHKLQNNLITIRKCFGEKASMHEISLNDFLSEQVNFPDHFPVIILSLDKDTAIETLLRVREFFSDLNGDIWIYSSVSKLSFRDIRRVLGLPSDDVNGRRIHLVRYIENIASLTGAGLIAAVMEKPKDELTRLITGQIFHDVGKIIFLDQELKIDHARTIIGSSIGVVAFLLSSLSQAIGGVSRMSGFAPEDAQLIVASSLKGVLNLLEQKNVSAFDETQRLATVPPSPEGKVGTTAHWINEINRVLSTSGEARSLDFLLTQALTNTLHEYSENPKEFEQ